MESGIPNRFAETCSNFFDDGYIRNGYDGAWSQDDGGKINGEIELQTKEGEGTKFHAAYCRDG
jgi:hypothetical protein